jgi:hypothetical protein
MGKFSRIVLFATAAVAFAIAATGSIALADPQGPGVTASVAQT